MYSHRARGPVFAALLTGLFSFLSLSLNACVAGSEDLDDLSALVLSLPASERSGFESNQNALSQADYLDLVAFWAPQIYQDTDDSYYKGDYLTSFDYDGDYNGKNNWENLDNYATVPAYVYYTVSETLTHYFIGYYFFHPRDWHEWLTADEHENDLEGAILAVKKSTANGGKGELVAMETQAHGQFYQYSGVSGVSNGSDTVDGSVALDGTRPKVFLEAKGHGVYNCDSRCSSAPGGDGIVYSYGAQADAPAGGSGNWNSVINYDLIAMDSDGSANGRQGLWYRRNDICDTCTYGAWGKIRGDNHGTNKALAPWAWDDSDDGQSYVGDSSCDPAKFFDIHLNGSPFDSNFSHTYVNHIYRTHSVWIDQVRSDKNRDPWNGKSDIYVRVTAPGNPAGTDQVLNTKAFKKNSANTGSWYNYSYGAYNAEGEDNFGDTVKSHSFCRPGSPGVKIEVYDSDSDADDYMGGENPDR